MCRVTKANTHGIVSQPSGMYSLLPATVDPDSISLVVVYTQHNPLFGPYTALGHDV